MRGNLIYLTLIGLLFLYIPHSNAQNIVVKGGGLVVEGATFLVVNGNIAIKNEVSDGKIDLNGTILLHGDISNQTASSVFINQEPIPNGWVIMTNSVSPQRIDGISPISFENLSLIGSEKILQNNNDASNGLLVLNSVFNLNKNNFILNNKNSAALEYHSGYLFGETTPTEGLGSFQWNISNSFGTYTIPFGSGTTDTSDIAIKFQVSSPGNSSGGILFATYPTDNSNTPFPEFVTSLSPYNSLQTIDRYWVIDPDSYSQKPLSSFTLKYRNSDVENGNNISKNNLKPISYKSYSSLWSDYSLFDNHIADNSISVLNLNSASFDKYWTLSSELPATDIFFPNAFSPDLDGDNEMFKPVINFIPKTYEMYVYNRWGNLLFSSFDPNLGWNGLYNNETCQIGTYAWVVVLVKPDGKQFKYVGHVNVVR